ncbi:NAC domain, IPR003441-like protein [Theobroma cacao]|uniref:NAC domain, IPR003441-like protein n=1 Tax=Theobroma cacao TaxID=3641 RepID=A0A061EX88_THECC|nr:NAC domain, IPR003441-like protein [Theobroma cacao]
MEQNYQHNKLTKMQLDDATQNDEYLNSFPPGVRFFPSDEELLQHYLKNKVLNQPIFPNIIQEVNLYQHHPLELTGMYKPLTETEWYFFTCRDRKHSKGCRPNRATPRGFWKQSGVEKPIPLDSEDAIGYKKWLIFYEKENEQVKRTDWKMHEYRIHDTISSPNKESAGNWLKVDGWVLCRIFKKKEKNNEEETETFNPEVKDHDSIFDDYFSLTAENNFPYQKNNDCFDDLEEFDLKFFCK